MSCIARAASSFPVPVAPVIKTDASVGAIRSMMEKTFRIGGDWPTKVGTDLTLASICGSKDLLADLPDGVGGSPSIAVGGANDMGAMLTPENVHPGLDDSATYAEHKSGVSFRLTKISPINSTSPINS